MAEGRLDSALKLGVYLYHGHQMRQISTTYLGKSSPRRQCATLFVCLGFLHCWATCALVAEAATHTTTPVGNMAYEATSYKRRPLSPVVLHTSANTGPIAYTAPQSPATARPLPQKPEPKLALPSLLRCTHEPQLMEALKLLQHTPAKHVLEDILHTPVRILFKPMAMLGKGLRHYDALSWISVEGQRVIFINEIHRGAPPEALAALIAHEGLHADAHNSVQEEIAGSRIEAEIWIRLRQQLPVHTIGPLPTTTSPLVLRLNTLADALAQGTLENMVRSNPGYRLLPEQ